jgi:hypothetical protein
MKYIIHISLLLCLASVITIENVNGFNKPRLHSKCEKPYERRLNSKTKRSVYQSDQSTGYIERIWNKPYLTYSLSGNLAYKNQTSAGIIERVVKASFNEWQFNSPYRFKKVFWLQQVDIKIIFTRDVQNTVNLDSFQNRIHDCDRKLQNMPAHAFYRDHNRSPGEIHVNNEFLWLESTNPTGSISLKTILLHEIGHVLGLSHSRNKFSIMYPFIYTNEVKNITLQDSIDIHLLYRQLCYLK